MEETLSGKVTQHSCKMCMVWGFSKRQHCDMKSLFAAYSAWDFSRREAAGPVRKKVRWLSWRKLKCCVLPWAQLTSFLLKGCGMIASHSYLIWIAGSCYSDKQAWSLCSCRVQKYPHEPLGSSLWPWTDFGCLHKGVQVRGRYYDLMFWNHRII